MTRPSMLAAILLLIGSIAHAAEEPLRRTISVTGTATIRTQPDTVVWTLTLRDEDVNLRKAKTANDKKLAALIELRDELNIPKADFEAGQVSIHREVYHDGEKRGQFRTYSLTRSIVIRQRDLKRFDEYFEKLVSRAEIELHMHTESSKALEHRKAARLQALKVAKEKAETMAGALNVQVGKAVTVSEDTGGGWMLRNSNSINDRGAAPADADTGTFAPGATEITVSVQVSFELE